MKHLKRNSLKSYAWSLCNIGGGAESFAAFIKSPKYIFNIIPKLARSYSTRNANNIPHFKVKHSFFRNTLFPSVIIEWNKLDLEIQNALIFKKNILKFIRPTAYNIFGCHNLKGIKYLARLRLVLSHLYEHKFKDNFQDTLDPI